MTVSVQILWMDDERTVVDVAARLLRHLLRQRDIHADIDIRERPGDGVLMAQKRAEQGHSYDLVICDLDFNDKQLDGIDAIHQIQRTLPSTTILVYSGKLEAYAHSLSSLRPSPLRVDKAADLSELTERVASLAAVQEPRILHLSDLHFGSMNGFANLQRRLSEFFFSDEGELSRFIRPRKPNLVVVTGDVASTADQNDYRGTSHADGALPFLTRLLDELCLNRDSCIFVPGNHDIHLGAPAGQEWFRFARFLRDFYGHDPELGLKYYGNPARIMDGDGVESSDLSYARVIAQHRAVVVGMNSCTPTEFDPSQRKNGVVRAVQGLVTANQINAARAAAGRAPADYLRIALMHHPVFPVPTFERNLSQDRVVNNWGLLLRTLSADAKFHLLLHGHCHYPSVQTYQPLVLPGHSRADVGPPLHVVAGAALGARRSDRQTAFPHMFYQFIRTAWRSPTHTSSAEHKWSARIEARMLAMDTLRWTSVSEFAAPEQAEAWFDLTGLT